MSLIVFSPFSPVILFNLIQFSSLQFILHQAKNVPIATVNLPVLGNEYGIEMCVVVLKWQFSNYSCAQFVRFSIPRFILV